MIAWIDGSNSLNAPVVNPATAPHDCIMPDCPGPENKRKLEAFDDLLTRVKGWMQRGHMKGCYHADFTDFPDARFCQAGCKALRAAIAKASLAR